MLYVFLIFEMFDLLQFMIADYGKASLNQAFMMKKTIYDEKNNFTMKIEHMTCIWMFVYAMILSSQKWQKSEVFDISGPTCLS